MMVKDGFTTLEGGMDSGTAPETIAINQYAFGVNCRSRGAFVRQRPPINKMELRFSDSTTKTNFRTGRPQSALYYNPGGNRPLLMMSGGGRLFQGNVFNNFIQITDVSIPSDLNAPSIAKNWMVQADIYLVLQDGSAKPIIFDGGSTRRALVDEVPIGTAMAFGLNRLVVGNGRQFFVGDILGGPTSVLKFTEQIYLAEGGSFLLPIDMGDITGMIFNARQDTSTGQGALLIFGHDGVISVNLLIERILWKTTNIMQVVLTDIGAESDSSLVAVNGDVLFRSDDGLRSLRDARAEEQGYGKTPISREMDRILCRDSQILLPFIPACKFDNRFLMGVNPFKYKTGAVCRGLLSLDFAPVASNRSKSPPAYDGLWTGCQPVEFVTGKFDGPNRCFAICVSGNEEEKFTEIFEVLTDNDTSVGDNGCPIDWSFEGRATAFSQPFVQKQLETARLWMSDIKGLLKGKVEFRPDYYPGWITMHEFEECFEYETCGTEDDCSLPNLQAGYLSDYQMPMPSNACNPITKTPMDRGELFQFKFSFSGNGTVNRVVYEADDGVIRPINTCPP